MAEQLVLTNAELKNFLNTTEENTPDTPYEIVMSNFGGGTLSSSERNVYISVTTGEEFISCGYMCRNNKNVVSVNIPYCQNTNATEAFINCVNLKRVTFGETVKFQTLTNTFYGCSNLLEVSMNSGNIENGYMDKTFYGCTSLKTVDFSILEVSGYAGECFYGCSSLNSDIILNLYKDSGGYWNFDNCFENCKNIKNIKINITNGYLIARSMIKGCNNVSNVEFNLENAGIGIDNFDKCETDDEIKNYKFVMNCSDSDSGLNNSDDVFTHASDIKIQYGLKYKSTNNRVIRGNVKNLEIINYRNDFSVSSNFITTTSDVNTVIYKDYADWASSKSLYLNQLKAKNLYFYFNNPVNAIITGDDNITETVYIDGNSGTNNFGNCKNLKSVIIKNQRKGGVFSFSFSNCPLLKKAHIHCASDNQDPFNLYLNQAFEGCSSLEDVEIKLDVANVDLSFRETFKGCKSLVMFKFPEISGEYSSSSRGVTYQDMFLNSGIKIIETNKKLIDAFYIYSGYGIEYSKLSHVIINMMNEEWDDSNENLMNTLASKMTLKNLGGNNVTWKHKLQNSYIKLRVTSNSITEFHTHVNSLTQDSFTGCPNLEHLYLDGVIDQDSSLTVDGDIVAGGKIKMGEDVVALEKNIPTQNSQLENDSGFITSADIPTNVSELNNDAGYITSSDVPTKVSELTNDTGFITSDTTKLPLAGGTMTGAITFASTQTWPTFNQDTTGKATTAGTADVANKLKVSNHDSNDTNYYPIWANGIGTANRDIFTSTALKFNPSKGNFQAKQFTVNDKVTLQWNSTTSSLDFTFN